MPALKNQRHEAFAKLIAQGVSGTQAYLKIYKDTNQEAAMANASRLIRTDKVGARILELKEKSAEKVVFGMQEQLKWALGLLTTPIGEMDEKSQFVNSITRSISERGESVTIKTPDKMKALEFIGKLTGTIKQSGEEAAADPKRLSLMIVQNVFNGSTAGFLEDAPKDVENVLEAEIVSEEEEVDLEA